MRIIEPIEITDAEFTSSTIAEPDTGETLWSGATTYNTGDLALVTDATDPDDDHWIYISLKDSNTNNKPEDNQTGEDPWWGKYQRSNRWRMWDSRSKNASSRTTSITTVVDPDTIFNAVALLNIEATSARVVVTDPTAGTVYDETVDLLDLTDIIDFYPWFFYPLATKKNVILMDLPAYPDASVQILITNTGGTAEVGEWVIGNIKVIGAGQHPYKGGIANYNRKSRDLLEYAEIEEREFVNTMNYNFHGPSSQTYGVTQTVGRYIDKPAVFLGYLDDDAAQGFGVAEETILFGFVKNYTYNVTDVINTQYSLKVEELV